MIHRNFQQCNGEKTTNRKNRGKRRDLEKIGEAKNHQNFGGKKKEKVEEVLEEISLQISIPILIVKRHMPPIMVDTLVINGHHSRFADSQLCR